jgi:GT2 family glycosyltransferase
MPSIVVVRDRNDATHGDDVKVIDGRQPFVFARNCNLGIQYFGDKDIFLCNDDIEVVKKDFFHKLHAIADKYPKCGMMSPLIKGGVGNDVQSYYKARELPKGTPKQEVVKTTLHFPCILLKRRMIHRIGLLDENFVGYGFEDVDYCLRAYWAGFDVMVTRQLYVKHGDGEAGLERGKNYSVSFAKEPEENLSMLYFQKKYKYDFNRPTGNSARVFQGG